MLGAELNAFLEQPTRSVALAEATAAAQHGHAAYDQATDNVKVEASGSAPAMRGRGPLGAPSRSASEQVAAEPHATPAHREANAEGERAPRVGLAGRLIGLVGLLGAALLLRRGESKSGGQSARA
jgi:hypothetical protein